jgi:transcriptional regulator with XRE-family HTH domain
MLPIVTGDRLRDLRTRLGLSQEGLARLLGVAFATINRWENEKGASGPRGAVLVVLQALEEGLRHDRHLPKHLTEWSARGQPYLMHRLFALAYGGGGASAARRTR